MQPNITGSVLSADDVGQGPPLVFLHGFPLNRRAWQKQVAVFQKIHRIIAPDLRGFGMSAALAGETTMGECAADVHALLQQLTTGPVVLVGHSMGGYVALAFARQFPDMLRGLVLVSTKATQDTGEAAAGRRAMAHKVKTEGPHDLIESMLPKMLTAYRQDVGMKAQVQGFMASATAEGIVGSLLGMADRPDSTALLGQISVPTLIIAGGDDAVIPPVESERMAQLIPGAELAVIPYAGHLVAFEQPDEFNRILKEWLIKAT